MCTFDWANISVSNHISWSQMNQSAVWGRFYQTHHLHLYKSCLCEDFIDKTKQSWCWYLPPPSSTQLNTFIHQYVVRPSAVSFYMIFISYIFASLCNMTVTGGSVRDCDDWWLLFVKNYLGLLLNSAIVIVVTKRKKYDKSDHLVTLRSM